MRIDSGKVGFEGIDPIRVLHIFAPCYKNRFGGPVIQWKYYFAYWNDPRVVHAVLDTQTNQLVDSREVFNFQYRDEQKTTTKWERITWIPFLFRNLIKHRQQYDLLHVHVLWWGGLLIGPWAKWNKCPSVYESVLLGADTPSGIIKEKFGKIKLWCLKSYKAILAISDYLADDYLKNGFTSEQVFMQMNSVDTDLFRPADSDEEKTSLRKKYDLPIRSRLLLFVGSVIERKGVDILLKAYIESCLVHPNLHLLIIGAKNIKENPSLDEDFVNRLFQLLEQNGMSKKVSFFGLLQDRERLAEIYRAADIFVFPSLNEGLPSVVLEAMAAGLPVVASHLLVLEKVIKNGENGFFVPVGNIRFLMDSIVELSDDPQLTKRTGYNARSYIEVCHGFETWQSQLVEFYKRKISK